MLRNVFTKTIRDRRKATTWWIIGSAALIAWVSLVYPILRDSDEMQSFIEELPPEIMAIFGMDPATYLTGAGFLHAQFYSMFGPLMLIGFAVALGVSATASEEKNGTLDMLLSTPISRTSLLLQKAGVMMLLTALVTASIAAMMLVLNLAINMEIPIEGIVAANLALWLIGLVFGGVAIAAGAVSGRPATAMGVAIIAAIVSWFVNAFANIFDWLEIPAKASPFTWYLEGTPLIAGWSSGQAWLAVAFIALVAGAVVLFKRRNIATDTAAVQRLRLQRRTSTVKRPRATWLLRGVAGKSVWDRRRSVWVWAIGLASLMIATFAAWPTFAKDSAAITDMISAMPKELFAMFGMTDPDSLATPAGFISSRTYQSIGPIVIIVFTIGAVSSSVAKEEAKGNLDLVLSTPVSRGNTLFGKAVAVAALTLFIGAVLSVFGFIGNAVWDTGLATVNILAANTGLALLGLCFGGIAIALWSLLGSGPAVGITAAIGTVTWFLNGLGAIVDSLAPLRILSPFYWYLGDTAPLAKGFVPQYLLLLLVAVIGTAVALWRFQTSDLAT